VSRDRTDAVIAALGRDARPVRRIPPLRRQLATVLLLAAAVAVVVVAGLGLRAPGLPLLQLGSPFLWMALGLAAAGVAGATSALAFARPGREAEAWRALALGLAALGLAGLASAYAVAGSGASSEPIWRGAPELPCIIASLVFSLPAALLVTRLASRAAPLQRGRTAFVSAGSATALGALAAHLICRTPGEWHVVVTHALEPFVGALLLAAPLYALLRWWRR